MLIQTASVLTQCKEGKFISSEHESLCCQLSELNN